MRLGFLMRLLLACTCLFSVHGQELFFEQVTGSGEVPNTSIHGIAKDSMGFIWVGSWHGLYRYDGVQFEVFRHSQNDPNSLTSNRIRNILTDDTKQLWILTYNKQYLKYNYSLRHFNVVADSLVPNNVSLLLNSSANFLNKSSVIDGYRYIVFSHRFMSINLKTKTRKAFPADLMQPGGLTDDYITSFYIDDQGIIWLGSRSGMLYKANTNRKPFNLAHLYADRANNRKTSAVRVIYKENDKLWLGTNHSGLVTVSHRNNYKYAFKGSASEEMQVRSIEKDALGNVWIGGVHGLGYFDASTGEYHVLINSESHPNSVVSVYDLLFSKDKKYLWAIVFNSLVKIDIATKECHEILLDSIIDAKSIMCMVEDESGYFWVGTEGNGIYRLKLNSEGVCTDQINFSSEKMNLSKSITGNLVYTLCCDSDNNIWAGTSEGLNCINATNLTVKHITHENGIGDSYISAITRDKDGCIWVSHKKGISRIIPTTFAISNYPIISGNQNWTFLDGSYYNDTINNTLYFGATEGYVSFNPSEINDNPFKPKVVLDKLYFSDNEVEPNKTINGRVLLHQSLALSESLELGYNNRNFSIGLSAFHYERPKSNRILYKLEGYDKDWIKTVHNTISYARIPAGNYVLNVKAVTPDGTESEVRMLKVKIKSPWYATNWAVSGYIFFVLLILFLVYREILSRERLKNKILLEHINIEKKEELNRDRIEFFTNVSHELRTPLTLITDPIKQLKESQISVEKRQKYWDIISRNVEHLSTLINQLLDFRKAESGKLEVNYTIEDAIKLIRQCVESFYMNANNRDISLKYNTDVNKFLCYVDRNMVEQILFNLISNAFKYTSNGGQITINVSVEESSSEMAIEIIDNGVGIDNEAMSKIFEPFNTVGAKPFHGNTSGIGLALTRNLVRILNGDITLDSEVGKGTTVAVRLPYKTLNKTEGEPEKEAVVKDITQAKELSVGELIASSETPETKPIVLIVEDNEDVQEYLKSELEEEYVIYLESNGIDGLASATQTIPDLIVSDVMMPYMDGVTLCKEIKQKPQTCHIPVVLLTAKTSEENKIEGLNTGADYYISKPFSIAVLKAQLKSIIDNRKKLQQNLANTPHLSALEEANSGIDNDFLLKVIDVVYQNIAEVGFSNEDLANALQISQRQLYRKIKALSGSTIQEFMIRVKMDEAVKYLVNTSLTISEISYTLGFSEPSNFSRTFTKHYGQSPTKWLKANKANYK